MISCAYVKFDVRERERAMMEIATQKACQTLQYEFNKFYLNFAN